MQENDGFIRSSAIDSLKGLQSWEERYKAIIALGKQMKPFPEEFKTDDLKVKGCQSQVWIKADLTADGRVEFLADSDALIVKGLVALLLSVYSGQTPQQILANPPEFIKELGFANYLSPNRANGLYAMVKQIQYYALAFEALQKSKL